ncbi:PA0069 family radical SAM protein [Aliikangiella sp. G2MR2-5]|uniref:PA0069 family radical SAM protein n=1 Tax=Aliikangiella sp. G2MR2-5 TaxID=2788943 RepID=UPI0018A9CFCF|nr:PA0069 family radical SAM protein [Aliikangiella sp. G2MR2-5]
MTSSKYKTRATPQNIHHRFEKNETVSLDLVEEQDIWWFTEKDCDQSDLTELIREESKTIISSNRSPDVPFEYSINPYRGCEHGCIYCYARPTHAYWDFSPGYDFESKIIYKSNAVELLKKRFQSRGYQCKPICIGANTDCYQPAEKKLEITRNLLKCCLEYRHPVSLITKSQLICRDIDLLSELAKQNLVSVAVSMTTLNNNLKRKLEPRTASPNSRLATIQTLAAADIPVTALIAPIIPAINDHELESIIQIVAQQGASKAAYIILRLPHEVRPLFLEWLDNHYPLKKGKVLNYLKSLRKGQLNHTEYGKRMSGEGIFAKLIEKRFSLACIKHGIERRQNEILNTAQFSAELNHNQLTLF